MITIKQTAQYSYVFDIHYGAGRFVNNKTDDVTLLDTGSEAQDIRDRVEIMADDDFNKLATEAFKYA